MLFPIKSFDEVAKETKMFGNFLMKYSKPKVSAEDDADIEFLKSKDVSVDGYSVAIYYSRNEYDTHYMEIVQVTGRYVPFLPFYLVCKIAKKLLGDKHLSYVDFNIDGRKTYCWTLASDKAENPIPMAYKKEFLPDDCVYEGLCYKSLNNAQNF